MRRALNSVVIDPMDVSEFQMGLLHRASNSVVIFIDLLDVSEILGIAA